MLVSTLRRPFIEMAFKHGSEHEMVAGDRKTEESVKQRVYRTLRARVMCGAVAPGLAITMQGVAADLGVSTMPVREALHRLVAEGALEHLDNRRVRVPRMTPAKFEEIIAARLALEPLAAERALPHIDEDRLLLLQKIDSDIGDAYAADDLLRSTELNFAFHRTMYEPKAGTVLLDLMESVWLRLGPFMRLATANLEESYRIDRHAEAMEAIRSRDAGGLKAAIIADIQDGIGHLGRHFFNDGATSPKV
ncbi:GntR family transcriptional regulator [Rhizobium sp. AG855]|uniref:GntR family transcriptional regulator n=1 Tax=Rhizobium sp. AG855 TaxID=2183898 RepID=UPI000FF04C23|nr:GntR family transcriptional regulator [Rhizobium sp. AG855]RKE80043.1 GntR family transcriptional regulator [Rhizobium sp. AG855]